MIIIILKLFLLFTPPTFFAWQFLRKILKQNEIYLLVPASIILGMSAFVLFSNIFAYFLSISSAFILTLLMFLVSGLLLYLKGNKSVLTVGIEKKYLLYLVLISVSFVFIYGLIFFSNNTFDEGIHRIYSSSIANDNFPVRDPFNFSYSVQYHYGFNIFIAGISIISGLSIIRSVDVGMLFLIFPVFWMVFALVYGITKNYRMGFLSAWFFFFAGGFRYLTVLGDLDYSKIYLVDYFRQIAYFFFSDIPNSKILGPGYFHPYSIDTYSNLIYHPPTAMVMPIILLIVWLLYKKRSFFGNKNILNVVIGSLIGLTALVSEDKFLVIIASLGIFAVWKIFSQKIFKVKGFINEFLSQYGIIFLTSIILAVFQGGILSDMFASIFRISKLNLVESISTVSAVTFRYIPGVIARSGFYPFSELYSWIFLITEWGIPILLFPFILFYFYRKKNEDYYFLILMILIGFAVSFFINYSAWPAVFYRFATTGYMLLGILLGIFLIDWCQNIRWKKNIVIVSVILMAISPIMFSLKAIPVRPFLHQLEYEEKEILISEKIKGITDNNSIILSADPQIVVGLFERFAYETDKKIWNYGSEPFVRHLNEMSISDLKDRKIGYIYADPVFLQEFKDSFLKSNSDFLEEIFNFDNEYIFYKLK